MSDIPVLVFYVYDVVCDGCGERATQLAINRHDAETLLRERGWSIFAVHWCEQCVNRIREERQK